MPFCCWRMVSNSKDPDGVLSMAIAALLKMVVECYKLIIGLERLLGWFYGRLDKVTVQVDFKWRSIRGLC